MKNNLKPLQEYTQKDIDLSIEDLKDCIERVDAIGQLLSSFKIERKKAKDEEMNQLLVKNVSTYINEIQNSQGYKSFLSIFRLTFAEESAVGNPDLKGVIDFIQIHHHPDLPWPCIKRFVYSDELESKYIALTEESRFIKADKETDFQYEILIEPIQDAVRNEISSGKYPRATEIFDLWLAIKLSELFGEENSYKIKNLISNEIVSEKNKKSIRNNIEFDFKTYFKKILVDKQKSKFIPDKVDPNDKKWFELIDQAKLFREQLIYLRENFKAELNIYNLKSNEYLLQDIKNFVMENDLPPLLFPTVRRMQELPGGAGLIKRCNDVREGNEKGMTIVREKYLNHIRKYPIQQIEKPKVKNEPKEPETVDKKVK